MPIYILNFETNDGELGYNLILMGTSNCYQVGIQIVSFTKQAVKQLATQEQRKTSSCTQL